MSFFQHARTLVGLMAWLTLLESSTSAQWNGTRLLPAKQYSHWNRSTLAEFAPEYKIGGSCLAFAPDGNLYTACEKFPDLLVFFADNRPPKTVHLTGDFPKLNGLSQVDIEGMSIHDGQIYMVDEDRLVVYVTPLNEPGTVSTLQLTGGAFSSKDAKDNVKARISGSSTNYSSLEGIVVSSQRHGPESIFPQGSTGPFFYLLDECEQVGDRRHAKIYFGQRVDNEIRINPTSASFPLGSDYRLPELFEHGAELYALKTRYNEQLRKGTDYEVVRCDLNAGTLHFACSFKNSAEAVLNEKQWDNNFEGAAVSPDGQLYLIADNEQEGERRTKTPQPKDSFRGITPLVVLEKN